ncbi:hypothetical protein N5U23_04645 [Aliarcobacter butzleri]|uniref:hypothetical protein n=1 Tax=Aliarcobacter butzleri TaxID=28197 RepID=UPI0021B16340|nr:hypothetical protein [Aliarcobacter butzleri]MCT7563301.1 hypothetical protein [Aliarcobacter butzleri]MCT7648915.1 hypothetical protein [Aliarcobacter butzleri]
MYKIINRNKIGNVKIFKDELKNVDDFESYKNMFNSHINREGTADEYVSFNTINLSNMKDYKETKSPQIKEVYKISQYNLQGGHCCDFGLFSDKEKAIQIMLKKVNKLYPGFKKKHWYDNNSEVWHYDEKDFFIRIDPIKLNVFEEL